MRGNRAGAGVNNEWFPLKSYEHVDFYIIYLVLKVIFLSVLNLGFLWGALKRNSNGRSSIEPHDGPYIEII